MLDRVFAGEVHEEQTRSSHGGDGRLLRRGPRHHSPQQQLPVWPEAECVVSSEQNRAFNDFTSTGS